MGIGWGCLGIDLGGVSLVSYVVYYVSTLLVIDGWFIIMKI